MTWPKDHEAGKSIPTPPASVNEEPLEEVLDCPWTGCVPPVCGTSTPGSVSTGRRCKTAADAPP